MKKLITSLLLLLIGVAGFSQVVVSDTTYVNKKVSDFGKTLDSTIIFKRQTVGAVTLVIDTLLRSKSDTSANYAFSIVATNTATGENGWGQRSIFIKRYKGVCILPTGSMRSLDGVGMGGEGTVAKLSWAVAIVNGLFIFRIAGLANTTINWVITEKPGL